jgi:hypothetical protein
MAVGHAEGDQRTRRLFLLALGQRGFCYHVFTMIGEWGEVVRRLDAIEKELARLCKLLEARPRVDEAEPDNLTPSQVAKKLNVSLSTVLRIFSKVPGVIDLAGQAKTKKRGQRPYRVLRIPRGVLARWEYEHRRH